MNIIFAALVTIVLVSIPRHPHPSTLNTIDTTGKYFENPFLTYGKCLDIIIILGF